MHLAARVGSYPRSHRRFGDRGGVDARFQPLAVQIIGQSFHVGKVGAGSEISVVVAGHTIYGGIGRLGISIPAIIDVDVGVAMVRESAGEQGIGLSAYQCVADMDVRHVPGTPAHGRSERDRIPHHNAKNASRLSLRIMGANVNGIGATVRCSAGNDAGSGIDGEPGRKAGCREPQGTRTYGWDSVKKWVVGMNSIDARSIDSRRRNGR